MRGQRRDSIPCPSYSRPMRSRSDVCFRCLYKSRGYKGKARKPKAKAAQFRRYSLTTVYDFERDVEIGEYLDSKGVLPSTFMLLQPQSWHPDVWTDVARMRTLNMLQAQKGKEAHLCPLQFDIVDRLIEQFSSAGDVVFDPFSGLGTVAYCAIKQERRGLGIELNARYFDDSVAYCRSAEHEVDMPSLFDLTENKDADDGQIRLPGDVGAVRDIEINDSGEAVRA